METLLFQLFQQKCDTHSQRSTDSISLTPPPFTQSSLSLTNFQIHSPCIARSHFIECCTEQTNRKYTTHTNHHILYTQVYACILCAFDSAEQQNYALMRAIK